MRWDEENPQRDATQASDTDSPAADEQRLDMEKPQDIPEELAVDTNWDDIYDVNPTGSASAAPSDNDNNDFLENQSVSGNNLQEHLLWQLNNSQISETDLIIGITNY